MSHVVVRAGPGRLEIRRKVPGYVDLPLVLAALAGLFLFFAIAARPTVVTCSRQTGSCQVRTSALEAHAVRITALRGAKVERPKEAGAVLLRVPGRGGPVEVARTPWLSAPQLDALAGALRRFAAARSPPSLEVEVRSWLLALEVGGAFVLLAALGAVFRRRWFKATLEVSDAGLRVQRRDLLSTAHAPLLRPDAALLEEEQSDDGARRLVLVLPEGRRLALMPWAKGAAALAQVRAEVERLLRPGRQG